MFKCANCDALPTVEYMVSENNTIKYCDAHLPSFLKKKGAEKNFKRISESEAVAIQAFLNKAKK